MGKFSYLMAKGIQLIIWVGDSTRPRVEVREGDANISVQNGAPTKDTLGLRTFLYGPISNLKQPYHSL